MPESQKVSFADAMQKLQGSQSLFLRLLQDAQFDAGLYQPFKVDIQTTHERDEIYVIASGVGTFVMGGKHEHFVPGDLFFVAKGVEHRFEDFSDDFAAWVIFIGARR